MTGDLYRIILLLLIAFPCHAKKLYKYQDEKGVWQFSDVAPNTHQPVEVRQLKVSGNNQQVWLQHTGSDRQPQYFVRNAYAGSVELEVQFVTQSNVRSDPELPRRFTIASGISDTLFTIDNINPYKSSAFRLKYSYILGKPLVNYHSSTLYLPPIASHSEFQISQAFDGKFSHTDPQNKYAVDIMMPVGSPIYAARSGVVMEVKNDFFEAGTNEAFKSKANSIRIEHDDGSMAVYAHLALEQAQVFSGQRVEAGDLIAYSGNTGFTTGPHLHFAVQINQGMKLVSVPFQFSNELHGPITPEAGLWLKGIN